MDVVITYGGEAAVIDYDEFDVYVKEVRRGGSLLCIM